MHLDPSKYQIFNFYLKEPFIGCVSRKEWLIKQKNLNLFYAKKDWNQTYVHVTVPKTRGIQLIYDLIAPVYVCDLDTKYEGTRDKNTKRYC
jgi:hypothetical protein